MSQPTEPVPGPDADAQRDIPRPIVKKTHWPFPLIWLVPIAALALAGYYVYLHHQQQGPTITLEFEEINGIKPDETPVRYRGVEIGRVTDIDLADDRSAARVHIRLARSAEVFAKEGARFWLVRPEISESGISGFGTVLSGPYISAEPGTGQNISDFSGTLKAPIMHQQGMRIVLHAERLEHLQPDSPVYYRGFQVGSIQDVRFSDDATRVNATAYIWQPYRALVRTDSEFWSVSGADVKGGVFSGLELRLESLRSLIAGGVSFASPGNGRNDPTGDPAEEGHDFVLHSDYKKEWLTWTARIPITPAPLGEQLAPEQKQRLDSVNRGGL